MTEGLEVKDLELKELFMKQDLNRVIEILDAMPANEVKEMVEINRTFVVKYYDLGRADLLRKHLSFVAYASFITEYAGKAGLYEEEEYQRLFEIFTLVIQMLQQEG